MVMTVATVTMTVKADYAWGGINHALATRNGHVAGAGRARPAPPASARRLDQHREPVRGQQAPYGRARVEAFCEDENRPLVTLPYGPF